MEGIKQSTIERFAALHYGGFLADVTDWVHPLEEDKEVVIASGQKYLSHIKTHLERKTSLGVYPLWTRNGVWMVSWCAVDLDEGEKSSIHADNLIALLDKSGVKSWKETSKSKGYHVWVYLQEPIAATVARKALTGACRIVDVPTKEVYPKQTMLKEGALGNCLRLPYPNTRKTGRHEVFAPNGDMLDLETFVEQAWENKTATGLIRKLLRFRADGDFKGNARSIWDQTTFPDRSEAMYMFASSLLWQDYSEAATLEWLRKLDERLEKFVGRIDREKQLENIINKATTTTRYRD